MGVLHVKLLSSFQKHNNKPCILLCTCLQIIDNWEKNFLNKFYSEKKIQLSGCSYWLSIITWLEQWKKTTVIAWLRFWKSELKLLVWGYLWINCFSLKLSTFDKGFYQEKSLDLSFGIWNQNKMSEIRNL